MKFVINYDYPNSSEDYIHRIGRTARSTKTGTAYTFFTPNNIKQVNDLISVLREANQAINPKLLQLVEDRGSGKGCSWSQCIALRTKWKQQIPPPASLQNQCGRWFCYQLLWPQKVFISAKPKNQHTCSQPMLWCTYGWGRPERHLLALKWNTHGLSFVALKERWTQVSCWQGKSHFLPWCHNSLQRRVNDSSEVRQLYLSPASTCKAFYSRFQLLGQKRNGV